MRNTFVIFLLSGFWHGANWTFIAWGAYHALLFLPLILLGKNRKYTNQVAEGRLLPTWKECGQMLFTFILVVIGWIIFRATGMPSLLHYIEGMFQWDTLRTSYRFFLPDENWIWSTNLYIFIMLIVEWIQRNKQHGLDFTERKIKYFRIFCIVLYVILAFLIEYYFCLSIEHPNAFIYFQF